MKSIAVIICWIGPFPNYFALWRNSCAANPTVDFLLFTDQKVDDLPENIHLKPITLAGIADTARKNLNVPDLVLETPYKLCDYKVMYGEIFKEELAGYDYWGYCDMDMLFGNLRKFFTDELLEQYDKLLTRGHLSLYRNTPAVNRRYLDPGALFDVSEVMHSNMGYAFDEWNGIFRIYKHNEYPMYDQVPSASASWLHKRFSLNRRTSSRYKAPAQDRNYQLFYYEDGALMRAFLDDDGTIKTDEFLYLHMMKRKFPPISDELARCRACYCTPGGFVLKEPGVIPDLALIKKLNPFYGTFYEKIERWIRRKILKHRNHKIFVRRSSAK